MAGEFVSIERSLVENLLSALDRSKHSAIEGHLADSIREIEIAIRAIRRSYFPRTYFSDGLWDILLELHGAEQDAGPIAVTNVGLEVGIPLATALRYIKRLEQDGYVSREPDPQDKRRFFISLTKAGRALMNDIFEETSRNIARQKRDERLDRPQPKGEQGLVVPAIDAIEPWIGAVARLNHR